MRISGLMSMKECLARYKLWEYLTANNGSIYSELFSSGSIFVQEPLTMLPSTFGGLGKYLEILSFYQDPSRYNSGTERVVNQTLENVYSRYLWIDNNTELMRYYMRDYIVNKYSDSFEIWQIILVSIFCCCGLGLVVLAFWLPSKPSDKDRLIHYAMSSKRGRKRTLESQSERRKISQQGAGQPLSASLGHSMDRSMRNNTNTNTSNKQQQLSDEIALVESETTNKNNKNKKGAEYGSTAPFDYQRLKDDDQLS
eukprot:194825_1